MTNWKQEYSHFISTSVTIVIEMLLWIRAQKERKGKPPLTSYARQENTEAKIRLAEEASLIKRWRSNQATLYQLSIKICIHSLFFISNLYTLIQKHNKKLRVYYTFLSYLLLSLKPLSNILFIFIYALLPAIYSPSGLLID